MKWQGLYRVGPDRVMVGEAQSERCMLVSEAEYKQWSLSPRFDELETLSSSASAPGPASRPPPTSGEAKGRS